MSKKLLIVVVILLAAILFVGTKLIFFKSSTPDKAVLKFATQMNKYCPAMIDVETRLDKVNALADNTLHFNYTLINRVKDSLNIENLKNYMNPVVMKKIKTSPVLSKYLDKNLTWIYTYNDNKGVFIFELTYSPEQLKQPVISSE
jgi:hypothetical protein